MAQDYKPTLSNVRVRATVTTRQFYRETVTTGHASTLTLIQFQAEECAPVVEGRTQWISGPGVG